MQVEATHGILPDLHGRVVAVVGEGQEFEIGKGDGRPVHFDNGC
jgi:hypothetical protein